MLSTIYSISALLVSFAILCLGHGLHNTLLGVRATIENYPEWITGLMMSGYFAGFIVGTYICARLIPSIGQIRTFAVFASVASAISLLHVLFINEITWIILRISYGVCIAGLYMVIESWLNALSSPSNRGRILSVYMVISFLSLALGQVFIFTAEPSEYTLFAVVSILISFSLVPITTSKASQPEDISTESFGFIRLFNISPLATIGATASGLSIGAFWGLGAVFFTNMGLPSQDVALLIGITFLGGLVFQWPIGYCSDVLDRRMTIAIVILCLTMVCIAFITNVDHTMKHIETHLAVLALLFGGFGYTLYSLFIALANDFLEPKYIVKASGGLIVSHAIGAILGPIVASGFMFIWGNTGLFIFMATINLFMLIVALIRVINGRKIPQHTSENFVSIPKAGFGVIELDPRADDIR